MADGIDVIDKVIHDNTILGDGTIDSQLEISDEGLTLIDENGEKRYYILSGILSPNFDDIVSVNLTDVTGIDTANGVTPQVRDLITDNNSFMGAFVSVSETTAEIRTIYIPPSSLEWSKITGDVIDNSSISAKLGTNASFTNAIAGKNFAEAMNIANDIIGEVGFDAVLHNNTMTGSGTSDSPLSVVERQYFYGTTTANIYFGDVMEATIFAPSDVALKVGDIIMSLTTNAKTWSVISRRYNKVGTTKVDSETGQYYECRSFLPYRTDSSNALGGFLGDINTNSQFLAMLGDLTLVTNFLTGTTLTDLINAQVVAINAIHQDFYDINQNPDQPMPA